MKETGIIRRIDDLGRVVVPKEIRRSLHIHEGDTLEIFLQDDMICYKKQDAKATLDQMLSDLNETVEDSNFGFDKIQMIRHKIKGLRDAISE